MITRPGTKQIFAIVQDLNGGEVDIRFVDDDYIVSARHIEIKDGGILRGVSGRGTTIDEAAWRMWLSITVDLKEHEYLVVHSQSIKRQAFKWTGYFWKQVHEPGIDLVAD